MSRPLRALLVTVALCAASSAAAYDWGGAKWELQRGEGVPYVVSNTLTADVPDREALEAIQIGHDVWTALPCSYMAWEYQGRTENTAWGAGDGQNVRTWRESAWNDSPTALGIASTIWDFRGLSDTDIKWNGEHHSWAHFREGPGGFDGRTDIASVGAHEVGHCNGFGHSDVPGSTMWPSTGPGDINGRSLGADDIAAACEVYPTGGEVPEPDDDTPPPAGNLEFGEDCSEGRCAERLFCISDGREFYCSKSCNPAADNICGAGFYCAQLSGGGGACARGEDPRQNEAGFGEVCGEDVGCQPGLQCVNDEGALYCSGPCAQGECPPDFFCAELQGGGDICARGAPGQGGPLPRRGEACGERGICERGLFCLNDSLNVDENTGQVIPYCTEACEGDACAEGFRCVDVAPAGTACQLIPSAGERNVGEECWVNPERPFDRPTCGDGLVCVDYVISPEQEVVDKGTCTKNCTVDDCCPESWGCVELTPVIGQCRPNQSDDAPFACQGTRPPIDEGPDISPTGGAPAPGDGDSDGGVEVNVGGDGDSGGCITTVGDAPAGPGALVLLCGVLLLGLRRRRI